MGGISQLNIGTNIFSIIADEQRCFNIDLPEILSWYEFGAANLTGAFIRAPSECDGMLYIFKLELIENVPFFPLTIIPCADLDGGQGGKDPHIS